MNSQKIRILLIDDQPAFCFDSDQGCVSLKEGQSIDYNIERLIEDHFDLMWLRDIKDMRAYISNIQQYKASNPQALNQHNILPELLLFDYCLTRGSNIYAQTANKSNPLSRFPQSIDIASLPSEPASIKLPERADRAGLIFGSLTYTLFSDHITVAIPATAHYDVEYSPNEMGLIEWVLESNLPFHRKSRSELEWIKLLKEMLPQLRKRILEQVNINTLRCNHREIFELYSHIKAINTEVLYKNHLDEWVLNFESKIYGDIIFSMSSLFFDGLFCRSSSNTNAPYVNRDEVESFISCLRKNIFNTQELSDLYSDAYNCAERYLSNNGTVAVHQDKTMLGIKAHNKKTTRLTLFFIMIKLIAYEIDETGQVSNIMNFKRTLYNIIYPNPDLDNIESEKRHYDRVKKYISRLGFNPENGETLKLGRMLNDVHYSEDGKLTGLLDNERELLKIYTKDCLQVFPDLNKETWPEWWSAEWLW